MGYPPERNPMQKTAITRASGCGILWGVALPVRNEFRLGGFDPAKKACGKCTRGDISGYATIVRKFYADDSGRQSTLVPVQHTSRFRTTRFLWNRGVGINIRARRQADVHDDCRFTTEDLVRGRV
jgi:hypothetical protein